MDMLKKQDLRYQYKLKAFAFLLSSGSDMNVQSQVSIFENCPKCEKWPSQLLMEEFW